MSVIFNDGAIAPNTNPQQTDEDGNYSWEVGDGDYRVSVTKTGYWRSFSGIVSGPGAVVSEDVALERRPGTPPPKPRDCGDRRPSRSPSRSPSPSRDHDPKGNDDDDDGDARAPACCARSTRACAGRTVRQVVFSLDGRVIKRVRRPDRGRRLRRDRRAHDAPARQARAAREGLVRPRARTAAPELLRLAIRRCPERVSSDVVKASPRTRCGARSFFAWVRANRVRQGLLHARRPQDRQRLGRRLARPLRREGEPVAPRQGPARRDRPHRVPPGLGPEAPHRAASLQEVRLIRTISSQTQGSGAVVMEPARMRRLVLMAIFCSGVFYAPMPLIAQNGGGPAPLIPVADMPGDNGAATGAVGPAARGRRGQGSGADPAAGGGGRRRGAVARTQPGAGTGTGAGAGTDARSRAGARTDRPVAMPPRDAQPAQDEGEEPVGSVPDEDSDHAGAAAGQDRRTTRSSRRSSTTFPSRASPSRRPWRPRRDRRPAAPAHRRRPARAAPVRARAHGVRDVAPRARSRALLAAPGPTCAQATLGRMRTLAPFGRRLARVAAVERIGEYELLWAEDADGPGDPRPGQFYMLAARGALGSRRGRAAVAPARVLLLPRRGRPARVHPRGRRAGHAPARGAPRGRRPLADRAARHRLHAAGRPAGRCSSAAASAWRRSSAGATSSATRRACCWGSAPPATRRRRRSSTPRSRSRPTTARPAASALRDRAAARGARRRRRRRPSTPAARRRCSRRCARCAPSAG